MISADDPIVRALANVHIAAQFALLFYGVHRLSMLSHWLRSRREHRVDPSATPTAARPKVNIQLPIYNERFVAARLIDAVAQLDWPRDRLEIQVLDDSTDETRAIADERAEHWRSLGVEVQVLRRADRTGYKAGALAAGLLTAKGEFVAIFDADFIPERDFLLRTIGSFDDVRVGMVQARWGFVNAEHSWLTRVQALSLGAHFRVEHQVRFLRGLFFNFNGTAGIWRRRAIEEAGGWQADTVTEDLDLSYRAQLAGWRFVYLDDVVVPSELPVTLGALRAQQHRWAKGSIQTARKILPQLLRAELPRRVKLEAASHLLGNLGWLLGAILLATLFPAVVYHAGRGWYQMVTFDLPLLFGSSGAILIYFACAGLADGGRRAWGSILLFPILSIGMTPTISAGVLAGMFSRGGAFERTAKYGVRGRERLPRFASVYHRRAVGSLLLNGALLCHGAVPLAFAIGSDTWTAVPLLLLIPGVFAAYLVQDLHEIGQMRAIGS